MEKSKLREPVGKVSALPDLTTGKMTGVAIIDLDLAPEGSELYVQPSVSRLTLEVEVATDNALHWRDQLSKSQDNYRAVRDSLREAQRILRDLLDQGLISSGAYRSTARKFLEPK